MSENRTPPASVLMRLARTTREHPRFVAWLMQKAEEGFGLGQPGDDDLTDEEWDAMASLRYSVLERLFLASFSGREQP